MWGSLRKLWGKDESVAFTFAALRADMHSHLLPGLDDGAETLEDSMQLLEGLYALGFRKLCMTPHVMGDFYKNTPTAIREKLKDLQEAVALRGIKIELSCAAEYYLDEWFFAKVQAGEELLTFGGDRRFLLIETSYMNEPAHLRQVIFATQAAGYTPVLAHPERYAYFYGRIEALFSLRETGVLFQINLNSLAGYYSKQAKEVARQLIKRKAVEFLGTDTHSMKHIKVLERVVKESLFQEALRLPLLNASL
ncbi:tyrosine-protein phosphatase [Rufibacter latericius]|uniref:protein-tyrosine-phosphatase n=1 Tax=Rufibacter latericius TaxID=2487040 RepID=A0A3M9MLT8_9BACT|nr:CpsB/CapC family capsule biosynthesis tyrosine phosphatase [Rufibacter latericius]RNI26177.1 capsular biosynthesis protein [Rufibacter latericius]